MMITLGVGRFKKETLDLLGGFLVDFPNRILINQIIIKNVFHRRCNNQNDCPNEKRTYDILSSEYPVPQ